MVTNSAAYAGLSCVHAVPNFLACAGLLREAELVAGADASAYPQHVCSAGMLGRKDCADLARCLAEHDGITQHATRMEHAPEHSSATEGSGRLIPQRNVAPGGQTKAWHLSWLQPA
jgi:hypothetical protein